METSTPAPAYDPETDPTSHHSLGMAALVGVVFLVLAAGGRLAWLAKSSSPVDVDPKMIQLRRWVEIGTQVHFQNLRLPPPAKDPSFDSKFRKDPQRGQGFELPEGLSVRPRPELSRPGFSVFGFGFGREVPPGTLLLLRSEGDVAALDGTRLESPPYRIEVQVRGDRVGLLLQGP